MPPKKGKRKDDFDFDNPEAELASLSMADQPEEPAAGKKEKAKGGQKHVEIEAPSMMDAAVDEDDAPAAGGAAKKGKDKKKKNKGKEDDFDFDNPPTIEELAAAAAEAQAAKAVSAPKAKSGFAALMGDEEDDAEEEESVEEQAQAKLTKEQEKAAAKEKARLEKEAEKARQEEEKQRQKEAKEREKEAKKAAAAAELAARVIPEHLKAEIPTADVKKAIQKIGFTFKKVIVAKVVSVSPHPKADNMCVVTVNNGRSDLVVVCSDITVQPGQLVPFAPVGSELEDPETQMSTDITARKLRGIDSYGMLCSEADLKLNEEGTPASSSHVFPVPPYCIIGADFAEQYLLYCNRPKLLKILEDAAAATAAAKEKQAAAAAAKAQAAAAKSAAADSAPGSSPTVAGGTPTSAAADDGEDEDDGAGGKKKKKKGKAEEKKPNAMVQRALEAAAAKRLEEERIAAAIQAAKEAEEAEIKRIEEEERAVKEEKERIKAAKKAAKDQAHKEGKAVSAKDKEREARNAQYLELLKKSGAAPSVLLSKPSDGAAPGEGGAAASAATKSFSAKDVKKKKREPKAGSVDDWDTEAQSVSLEAALKESSKKDDDEPIEVEGDSDDDGSSVDTDDVYDPAWDDDETLDKSKLTVLIRKAKRTERRRRAYEAAQAARTPDNIRSPVVVIMGHVDTGKTKLLDKIRKTNVQEGEAGGITQQIGATFFPKAALQEKTRSLGERYGMIDVKVPGLLIIDTPGHEAFSNLRSRGSSLCDIAILVVDIVHGLEPQTVESLNMLLAKKTPFVVALNKIDRMYGWQQTPDGPCRASLDAQAPDVKSEFNERCKFVIGQFNEKGLNAALYWENPDVNEYISLVPTSAITGEGIPDLLMSLVSWTQQHMLERIMYSSFLQCTVMEVKTIEGLGTTIDAILVNGKLRRGDTIALCGLDGPIFTQIRALLTPEPMKEMRVKNPYTHHKVLYGAMGVKISAQNMERTIAGSQLLVVGRRDDREDVGEEIAGEVAAIVRKYLNKDGIGVYVQASTLGSLEALLEFLKKSKIPVSAIGIGPVHKLDVTRASVMLERESKYAMILAFDVDVVPDAERLAKELNVKIFTAKIIYHLFDAFTAHMEAEKQRKKQEALARCVFPVEFTMLQKFNDEPIVMGVQITEGILKIGTPICVPERDFIVLGRVVGIQHDKKPLEEAKKGMTIAVKIEQKRNCQNYVYGRHFDEKCTFVSKMDRESIDLLKENFRDELKKDDWKLVVKLKGLLNIPGP